MSEEVWLPSLMTETPQEGYELAMKLSRKAVGQIQPDANVREVLRPAYANDPNSLTFASQVVAINYQTVAAANDYWRK